MAQGAGTLFRTMMAGLLMLAALVLFSVPSRAHAYGADHHAVRTAVASHAAPQVTGMRGKSALPQKMSGVGTVLVSMAPAAPADHHGCGEHGERSLASGCCFGTACPMMHGGVAPVGLLPMPPPDTVSVAMPPSLLSEGIHTLPALKPPRASV